MLFFSGFMFAVHFLAAIAAASILIFDTMSRAWRAIWLVFILGNAFGALKHLAKYLA